MLDRLLLLGATGDLAARYLIPALGSLYEHNSLPRGFRATGAAPGDLNDDGFRKHVRDALETHAPRLSANTRSMLPGLFQYRRIDFTADDLNAQVREALAATGAPAAAYLALPPRFFATAMRALADGGLSGADGGRIIVEKPFGTSLDDATKLNALAARIEGASGPGTVYRVDHVRGMPTLQNFVAMRFANRLLDAVWTGTQIECIEILWEETLALEGRAAFYDRTGALRDVMQNHMMQVLANVAMEPPASPDARDVADARVAALRAVRPPAREDMQSLTRRARYTAGMLPAFTDSSSTHVPDYAREQGVDPARNTETFAEVVLTIDTARWEGTRFVMRAGKALRQRRKEIVVHFRPIADGPFGAFGNMNVLRVGIDGPTDVSLQLAARASQAALAPVAMTLCGTPPVTPLPAYGAVLLDVLSGGSAHAVHGSEAEEAWRIVTPVLDAWSCGVVPLAEYPAGSDGPAPLLAGARRAA